jgi:hypothetical protein
MPRTLAARALTSGGQTETRQPLQMRDGAGDPAHLETRTMTFQRETGKKEKETRD